MAEKTLSDVTEGLREVNETLRQQAKADAKPNPKKHFLEEILTFRQNRLFHKQNIKFDVDRNKELDEITEQDTQYYKEQTGLQYATAGQMIEMNEGVHRAVAGRLELMNEAITDIGNRTTELLHSLVVNGQDGMKKFVSQFAPKPKQAGSAEAEDEGKKESIMQRLITSIQIYADRAQEQSAKFGNFLVDQAKDKGGKGFSFLKNMLGKFLLGGLMIGLVAFLNSPYFEKAKKLFVDTIVPGLAFLYDKVLVPLYESGIKLIMDAFQILHDFFVGEGGLGDAIDQMVNGDIIGGIGTAIKAVGRYLYAASTALLNFFARIFGFKEVDSIWGIITGAFDTMVDSISGFFDLENKQWWNALTQKIDSVWDIPRNAINTIAGFVADIFDIGDAKDTLTKTLSNFAEEYIINPIKKAVKAIGEFISGLFDVTGIFGKLGMVNPSEEDTKKRLEKEQREREERARIQEQNRLRQQRREQRKKIRALERAKKRQLTEIESGDLMTGIDDSRFTSLRGRARKDVVADLQKEITRLKREQENKTGTGASIVNAPVSSSSTNTTNHVATSSTSLINEDRVYGKLSVVK